MNPLIVGVDLGATQIRAAVTDVVSGLQRRAQCLTLASEGPTAVLGRIVDTIREVTEGADWRQVRGIGVGAPGPLDPWQGVICEAPNLPGWHNVPLKAHLEAEFGVPVCVGNDANLAALGEHRFGAGQGVNDLIYITISTGIGGGIIAGGRLLLGADGLAGEVGHMILKPDGPLCGCGNRGCLEALAAGPAIARDAVIRLKAGEPSIISDLVAGDLTRVSAETVNRAAHQGDALASDLLRQAGVNIGLGLVSLVHLFNPRLFLFGGGVSKAGDLLFEPMRQTLRERAMPSMQRNVRIQPAALGDDVGLWGAVALVLSADECLHP
jgi:glucokinase